MKQSTIKEEWPFEEGEQVFVILGLIQCGVLFLILIDYLVNFSWLNASIRFHEDSKKLAKDRVFKLEGHTKFRAFSTTLKTIFFDLEFVYWIAMLVFSVLGFSIHPGFYAVNLCIYIKENALLIYVIKSTMEHLDQVGQLLTLILAHLYHPPWIGNTVLVFDNRILQLEGGVHIRGEDSGKHFAKLGV